MKLLVLLLSLFSGAANATTFTASVTGNWNDGATFGNTSPGTKGVDYPGDLDNITIKAGIGVTVPTSYNAIAGSITYISGTGASHTKLTVNGTLMMSSPVVMGLGSSGYTEFNMNAGSTLYMSSYSFSLGTNGFAYNFVNFNGNITSHVVVNASGSIAGGNFIQGSGGGFDYVYSSRTYTDFNGMGQDGTMYQTTGVNFFISSCTYVNSREIVLPQMAAAPGFNRYIEHTDIRTPTGANVIRILGSQSNNPLGRNDITHVSISSPAAVGTSGATISIQASSVTIRDSVLVNILVNGNGSFGKDMYLKNNIIVGSAPVTAFQYLVQSGSCTTDGNFFYAEGTNPHFWQTNGTRTYVNNIIEINIVGTIDDDGDVYMYASGANNTSSGSVKNNIMIGKRGSALFMSALGLASSVDNGLMVNNTIYFDPTTSTSDSCFSVGEGYAGRSNMYPYIANNLCVSASSATTAHVLRDLNAGSAVQKVSTANYNATFNIAGAYYQGTGTYGVNDINNVNPVFIDPSREFLKWDTSVGGDGTSNDAITNLLKINSYGGAYNTAYSYTSLMNYIRTGFTPQALRLKGAGQDGSDIGAVAVLPPNGFFRAVGP